MDVNTVIVGLIVDVSVLVGVTVCVSEGLGVGVCEAVSVAVIVAVSVGVGVRVGVEEGRTTLKVCSAAQPDVGTAPRSAVIELVVFR